MRHRRASLYRYQITHVWGQLPAGVAVGVVVAESTYHGPTIEWAIWDMDGTEIAAWSARLIQ